MKSVQQLMDLSGRTALITGGAGHIGMAVGHALAEAGCAVAALDLHPDRCAEAAEELRRDHGTPSLALPLDLSKEEDARNAPARVAEALGGLDIVIHTAALVGTSKLEGWISSFETQSADVWRMALEVNLTSAFVLCQAATPLLRASGHGSIIFYGSIYGVSGPDMRLYEGLGMGTPVAYAASKGGLMQLTRWMATALAPDVRVNAISPGGVFRSQPEEFVERYTARTPLGRMATEEDLKGATLFLASDLSAYVTGQNLMVDGGWTAW